MCVYLLREKTKNNKNLNINKSRPPAGHVNGSAPQRPLGERREEEKEKGQRQEKKREKKGGRESVRLYR